MQIGTHSWVGLNRERLLVVVGVALALVAGGGFLDLVYDAGHYSVVGFEKVG